MRSGKSYFSPAIFRKNLLRFWPLWAAYLVVWLLALPLPMIRPLSLPQRPPDGLVYAGTAGVLELGLQAGAVITFLFAVAAAMAVWGFLYNPRGSAMTGALPVRREGLFFTGAASALAPMLAVHVLTFLAAAAVEAATGYLRLSYLLGWLAIVSMELILFFGMASFCAMLTGHIVVLPVLYVVLSFTAVVVEWVAHRLLEGFVYGLPSKFDSAFLPLSPLVQIMSGLRVESTWVEYSVLTQAQFDGWWILVIYCLVGLALLAAAFLLLRRRRLETAGDVVAVAALRPVFKYCCALGCALVLGWLFYYMIFSGGSLDGPAAAAALTLLVLLGCAIGYFAAAMLLKKSFRVFGQWKGFAVTALVLLALCAVCEFDLIGYERRVPDPAALERVTIGNQVDVCAQENLEAATALHRSLVAAKPGFDGFRGDTITVRLCYTLADGSLMERSYALPVDYEQTLAEQNESLRQYQALLNAPEAVRSRVLPARPVTAADLGWCNVSWMDAQGEWHDTQLTAVQAVELWETGVLPDLEAGGIGQYWLLKSPPGQDWMCCQLYMEQLDATVRDSLVAAPGQAVQYTVGGAVSLTPSETSVHTLAWLAEQGVEPITESASRALEGEEPDGLPPQAAPGGY